MIKSHKKLLIFSSSIIVISFISSIFLHILNPYTMCIFIAATLYLFKRIFGFEKRKRENEKDTIIELSIFILTFFILYYLYGMLVGFTPTGSSWLKIVVPIIIYTLGRELLRYQSLVKSEKSKLLPVISIVMMIVLDISFQYTVLN